MNKKLPKKIELKEKALASEVFALRLKDETLTKLWALKRETGLSGAAIIVQGIDAMYRAAFGEKVPGRRPKAK